MQEAEGTLEHEVVDGVHVFRLGMTRLEDGIALLAFEDAMNELLKGSKRPPGIVVNLGQVEYLVTTALAKLISFRAKMQKRKGTFALCCLRPAVQEVMEITGFDERFSISESESQAIARAK
jgi:anti-anti-sigma factor